RPPRPAGRRTRPRRRRSAPPRSPRRRGWSPRPLELLRLLERFLDLPDHVERLLRQLVALAVDDHLEALDRVLERDVLAFLPGEVLRHRKGLRQETLDLAGACHGKLVLGR